MDEHERVLSKIIKFRKFSQPFQNWRAWWAPAQEAGKDLSGKVLLFQDANRIYDLDEGKHQWLSIGVDSQDSGTFACSGRHTRGD